MCQGPAETDASNVIEDGLMNKFQRRQTKWGDVKKLLLGASSLNREMQESQGFLMGMRESILPNWIVAFPKVLKILKTPRGHLLSSETLWWGPHIVSSFNTGTPSREIYSFLCSTLYHPLLFSWLPHRLTVTLLSFSLLPSCFLSNLLPLLPSCLRTHAELGGGGET